MSNDLSLYYGSYYNIQSLVCASVDPGASCGEGAVEAMASEASDEVESTFAIAVFGSKLKPKPDDIVKFRSSQSLQQRILQELRSTGISK